MTSERVAAIEPKCRCVKVKTGPSCNRGSTGCTTEPESALALAAHITLAMAGSSTNATSGDPAAVGCHIRSKED
jgi:hypothetical protein